MQLLRKIKHYKDGGEDQRLAWSISIVSLILLQLIMVCTMWYYAA